MATTAGIKHATRTARERADAPMRVAIRSGWPDEKNQGCDMLVEEKIRKTFENAGFDDSPGCVRHKFRERVVEMQMKRMIEDDLNARE